MRLKKIKNAIEDIKSSKYYVEEPALNRAKWHTIFGNDLPIDIEIGMGKGNFIINMAKEYPNTNFIGIEKYDSVMVKAVRKLNTIPELKNLKLILYDARDIENIFKKEIHRIYLNFSDPWPKSKHEKRRLTSSTFLEKYEKIFENRKEIFQKTDNISFFEFSYASLKENGYTIKYITNDLWNDTTILNIPTEYEEKFVKLGIKINSLHAYKN